MVSRFTVIPTLFLLFSFSLHAVERIQGAGASFPAPLYQYWSFKYAKETRAPVDYLDYDTKYSDIDHVRIKYDSVGSGSGIKQISARKVDFGASDKPLKTAELSEKNLLQFPAVIGSIVVAFNVPGIEDETLKLTNETVAEIFAGRITQWNDPAIAKENPGLELPAEEIKVIHRKDSSGTTFNFTYFLSKSSPYWKQHFGIGKEIKWATGSGAQGNEGVADKIRITPYSVGYIENAYKRKFKFSAAVLQTASGKWVMAREANFKAAAKYAKWSEKNSFHQLLSLQPGDDSYPIVAATFILLPKEYPGMNHKVVEFFKYAFENGDESAVRLGYIPLPSSTKKEIMEYLEKNITPRVSAK